MTITTDAIHFLGGRIRMTWQPVAALGVLVCGAIAAAAFHNDVIAATLAGAAPRFAINRDADRKGPRSAEALTEFFAVSGSSPIRATERCADPIRRALSLDGTWSVTIKQSLRAMGKQHQLKLTNSHAEEGGRHDRDV
jgi:hypothetical protein